MIRGRLSIGRGGLDGLTLSEFCDIAWVELWDDCGPMGDHHQYRRIITELFIEGKDAYDIFYEVTEYDKKGKSHKKMKRLSDSPSRVSRNIQMQSAVSVLEQWKARSAELKAAREVASTPDG